MKPGVVVHTCYPNTWEAETGGLEVQNQSGLSIKTVQKAKLGGTYL